MLPSQIELPDPSGNGYDLQGCECRKKLTLDAHLPFGLSLQKAMAAKRPVRF